MSTSQVFFSSRLSARAIVAGTLSTFAIMVALMTLAGGFGIWKFDLTEIPNLGAGFWGWAFLSWIFSLYVSGYVVAVASRSISIRDGALHGFVTWASACVTGCLFMVAAATGRLFDGFSYAEMPKVLFWGLFISEVLALGGAVLGGIQGANGEMLAEEEEEKYLASHGGKLQSAFGQ